MAAVASFSLYLEPNLLLPTTVWQQAALLVQRRDHLVPDEKNGGMKFLFPENVDFITHFPFILWLEKGCTAFGGFSSADWYASVNVLSTLRKFPPKLQNE